MKTLILFLDAISFSDFNKKNFPFLHSLAQEGIFGEMEPFPEGYHTEYTMLTGYLPIKHGVWTWYYKKKNSSFSKIRYIKPFIHTLEKIGLKNFSRRIVDIYINLFRLLKGKTRFLKTNRIPLDTLEKFEIAVEKSYVDHNPLSVPTFFDMVREKGQNYVAMDYPTISDNKKTWFFTGKNDFKQLNRVKKLLEKYEMVYAHIWDLDAIEHKYGLHSKEAIKHMKRLDEKVKEIILSQRERIRIVIFSDHGGCHVKKTRNILGILKNYEADYFLGSTAAQIWLKNPEKDSKKLKEELKKKGYLVYDQSNIEKELSIPYRRESVGDILAGVKPEEQIYPDFFRDTSRVKSMHGYFGKLPELNGIFIMNGFGIKKRIKKMQLCDIVPTMVKAMKIKTPKIYDGKSRV